MHSGIRIIIFAVAFQYSSANAGGPSEEVAKRCLTKMYTSFDNRCWGPYKATTPEELRRSHRSIDRNETDILASPRDDDRPVYLINELKMSDGLLQRD